MNNQGFSCRCWLFYKQLWQTKYTDDMKMKTTTWSACSCSCSFKLSTDDGFIVMFPKPFVRRHLRVRSTWGEVPGIHINDVAPAFWLTVHLIYYNLGTELGAEYHRPLMDGRMHFTLLMSLNFTEFKKQKTVTQVLMKCLMGVNAQLHSQKNNAEWQNLSQGKCRFRIRTVKTYRV